MQRTFAYVGCRTTRERNAQGTGISVFEVHSTGVWSHVQTLAPLVNPSFLAIHPDQKTLYTVHGDNESVSAFRIDQLTGQISPLNSQSGIGRNPVHLSFSREAAALVIAGYATGDATRIPLSDDGSLQAPQTPPIRFEGSPGPHRVEQKSSHPHHIPRYTTRERDSDWHIVPDKGLDTVSAVRWLDDGPSVVRSRHTREGAGPRHVAFHPRLPLLYVVNELHSTLTTWSFNPVSGDLEPLHTSSVIPPNHHELTRAAAIAIAADGSKLYVTNRGHDSISTIFLDGKSGYPISVEWTSAQGKCPRFLCLGPDNKSLYVANENSHLIAQFQIDESGVPKPTGRIVSTGSPVCIVFNTVDA
ncbi:lactonase family protein [Paraburkholderia bannensis]|uniref:lactonase family protein n=1 Tax=Paraburkholderia bannensis TaxID=765414 RepID=UPI002AB71A73|nr:lactonase family protein [Paraburkholderia bannensis]